jgi:hypothetical protein
MTCVLPQINDSQCFGCSASAISNSSSSCSPRVLSPRVNDLSPRALLGDERSQLTSGLQHSGDPNSNNPSSQSTFFRNHRSCTTHPSHQRSWFTSGFRRSGVSTFSRSLSPERILPRVNDLSTHVSHESTASDHFGASCFRSLKYSPTQTSRVQSSQSVRSPDTHLLLSTVRVNSDTSGFGSSKLLHPHFFRSAFTRDSDLLTRTSLGDQQPGPTSGLYPESTDLHHLSLLAMDGPKSLRDFETLESQSSWAHKG